MRKDIKRVELAQYEVHWEDDDAHSHYQIMYADNTYGEGMDIIMDILKDSEKDHLSVSYMGNIDVYMKKD